MNKYFLDLGYQPLANNYQKKYLKKQNKYKLKLYFNTKNKLVSLFSKDNFLFGVDSKGASFLLSVK